MINSLNGGKWIALLFCFWFGPLLISGCSSRREPQIHDVSVIISGPCAAPCFYGLTPGETSSTRVDAILENLNRVDQSTITRHPGRSSNIDLEIRWEFRSGDPFKVGIAYISDVIQSMDIEVNGAVLLGELIDEFGPPQFMEVAAIPAEYPTCQLFFIWPTRGIGAQFRERGHTVCLEVMGGGKVPADASISLFSLFEKGQFSDRPGSERFDFPGLTR